MHRRLSRDRPSITVHRGSGGPVALPRAGNLGQEDFNMKRIAVLFAVMGALSAPAAAQAAVADSNSCSGVNLPLLRLC